MRRSWFGRLLCWLLGHKWDHLYQYDARFTEFSAWKPDRDAVCMRCGTPYTPEADFEASHRQADSDLKDLERWPPDEEV